MFIRTRPETLLQLPEPEDPEVELPEVDDLEEELDDPELEVDEDAGDLGATTAPSAFASATPIWRSPVSACPGCTKAVDNPLVKPGAYAARNRLAMSLSKHPPNDNTAEVRPTVRIGFIRRFHLAGLLMAYDSLLGEQRVAAGQLYYRIVNLAIITVFAPRHQDTSLRPRPVGRRSVTQPLRQGFCNRPEIYIGRTLKNRDGRIAEPQPPYHVTR
jgi:hypothetical protein